MVLFTIIKGIEGMCDKELDIISIGLGVESCLYLKENEKQYAKLHNNKLLFQIINYNNNVSNIIFYYQSIAILLTEYPPNLHSAIPSVSLTIIQLIFPVYLQPLIVFFLLM